MRTSPIAISCVLVVSGALGVTLSCSPPVTPAPPDTSATAGPTAQGTADPPSGELAQYGVEHVGVVLPGEDICEKNEDDSLKNPIQPGKYQGILQNARCEQQKFITMARVAQSLGVECNHCHAPHPTDPKKEDYPKFTEKKRIANWMFKTFIQGLRPTDGSKLMCKSCHTDEDKKPVAKILRNPRNQDYAQEWMHEVMTTQFVEKNGKRLKCKTCHIGLAPDLDGWVTDVIRRLKYVDKVERRDDLSGDTGE